MTRPSDPEDCTKHSDSVQRERRLGRGQTSVTILGRLRVDDAAFPHRSSQDRKCSTLHGEGVRTARLQLVLTHSPADTLAWA